MLALRVGGKAVSFHDTKSLKAVLYDSDKCPLMFMLGHGNEGRFGMENQGLMWSELGRVLSVADVENVVFVCCYAGTLAKKLGERYTVRLHNPLHERI